MKKISDFISALNSVFIIKEKRFTFIFRIQTLQNFYHPNDSRPNYFNELKEYQYILFMNNVCWNHGTIHVCDRIEYDKLCRQIEHVNLRIGIKIPQRILIWYCNWTVLCALQLNCSLHKKAINTLIVNRTLHLHCLLPIIDVCDCSDPFKTALTQKVIRLTIKQQYRKLTPN